MNRRQFLAAAALSVPASGLSVSSAEAAAGSSQKLLEVRTYHFASPEKLQAYAKFFGQSAIPALNRAGVTPVGAFRLMAKDNAALKPSGDGLELYVVMPHASPQAAFELAGKLAADDAYQSAGKDLLTPPKKDPAFTRYESTLLVPFASFPDVVVPTQAPGRLVQLRTYESHSEERLLSKMQMFDQGEIDIFEKAGVSAVFFGRAVAGPNLPNNTYMVSFENEAAQEKAWATFKDHPEWKVMSKEAQYKDTVSKITNLVLRPIEGSQI